MGATTENLGLMESKQESFRLTLMLVPLLTRDICLLIILTLSLCYLAAWILVDRVGLNYWLDGLFKLIFLPINSLTVSSRMVLIIFDSFPNPSHILPPSLLMQLCPHLFFKPNESNLCCPFTLGCVALQGSMVNLPRAIPLMKTDSSST